MVEFDNPITIPINAKQYQNSKNPIVEKTREAFKLYQNVEEWAIYCKLGLEKVKIQRKLLKKVMKLLVERNKMG